MNLYNIKMCNYVYVCVVCGVSAVSTKWCLPSDKRVYRMPYEALYCAVPLLCICICVNLFFIYFWSARDKNFFYFLFAFKKIFSFFFLLVLNKNKWFHFVLLFFIYYMFLCQAYELRAGFSMGLSIYDFDLVEKNAIDIAGVPVSGRVGSGKVKLNLHLITVNPLCTDTEHFFA